VSIGGENGVEGGRYPSEFRRVVEKTGEEINSILIPTRSCQKNKREVQKVQRSGLQGKRVSKEGENALAVKQGPQRTDLTAMVCTKKYSRGEEVPGVKISEKVGLSGKKRISGGSGYGVAP